MTLRSAIKKSERISFAGKLMQLKMVILSKTNQTQTNIGCFLSFVDFLWVHKIICVNRSETEGMKEHSSTQQREEESMGSIQ